jgi:hypothetical protein
LKYDTEYWQHEFSYSQIVLGDKSPHLFSDDDLYAVVGLKYINGENPTKIHPEVPPLGKLMIGAGIKIFDNQNFLSLLVSLISLYILYLIALETNMDKNFALLSILLVSLNSEFRLLAASSNLDVYQLLFLSSSMYFFLLGTKNWKMFFISSLLLGGAMSVKIFINGLILFAVYITVLLLLGNFKIFISYITSLVILPISFLSGYIKYFLEGSSLIEFIKFQRWLINWWGGNAKVPAGGIIYMIFTGKWKTWWEGSRVIKIEEWDISWPVITSLGFTSVFCELKKSLNIPVITIWLWVFYYLLFTIFVSPFPRYLELLFPFATVLSVYLLWNVRNKILPMFQIFIPKLK